MYIEQYLVRLGRLCVSIIINTNKSFGMSHMILYS